MCFTDMTNCVFLSVCECKYPCIQKFLRQFSAVFLLQRERERERDDLEEEKLLAIIYHIVIKCL